MSIWLPPKVRRELEDSSRAYQAQVLAASVLHTTLRDFNRELKRIDDRLELVWFAEDVDLPGVKPGRYHLVRRGEYGPPTLIPWETPDGGFREPDSGLFDWLARADLWNDRAVHERRRMEREAERQAERQRELERAERRQELVERVDAATKVRVSFSPQHRWTQNAAGRRHRRGNG